MWGFRPIAVHRPTNSEKPQVTIRFAFHFVERNNLLNGDRSHNHFDHFILTININVLNFLMEREVGETKADIVTHHLQTRHTAHYVNQSHTGLKSRHRPQTAHMHSINVAAYP